jgi:hypothetical protein
MALVSLISLSRDQGLQAFGKLQVVDVRDGESVAVKTGKGVPSQDEEHPGLGPGVSTKPHKVRESHPSSSLPQRANYGTQNPVLVNTFLKRI